LSDRVRDWSNIPNRDIKSKEPEKKFEDRQLNAALGYLRDQIKLANKPDLEALKKGKERVGAKQ